MGGGQRRDSEHPPSLRRFDAPLAEPLHRRVSRLEEWAERLPSGPDGAGLADNLTAQLGMGQVPLFRRGPAGEEVESVATHLGSRSFALAGPYEHDRLSRLPRHRAVGVRDRDQLSINGGGRGDGHVLAEHRGDTEGKGDISVAAATGVSASLDAGTAYGRVSNSLKNNGTPGLSIKATTAYGDITTRSL